MSYVLRHNPDRYGLAPDRHGYVDLDEFLRIAQRRYPAVSPERLRSLIDGPGAERFEIAANRLRARYGHSIPVEPSGEAVEPPERLYHGTESSRVERLLAEGLNPMDRRMVHLSLTFADAHAVASRRTSQPLVLRIEAKAAHQAGVAFYHESHLYLATHIPPQYLVAEPEHP